MANMLCRSALSARAFSSAAPLVSDKTLGIMQATLPAVAALGPKLTQNFYSRIFKDHPQLLDTFNLKNQSGGAQAKALFNSIAVSAISVLEGKGLPAGILESINQKHCALHVVPAQYDVVGANLLASIDELLSPPKEALDAWGEFYGVVAKACIDREEAIYKQVESSPGGWRGMRDFKVAGKRNVSDSVVEFELAPKDGKAVAKHIPGQYTTVWVHPPEWKHRQPRHYSLCSVPSTSSYTIAVKRGVDGGYVSAHLHDKVQIGDTLLLSPPHGDFHIGNVHKLWISHPQAPVVLISAGIGMTPVLSILSLVHTHANQESRRPVTWLHATKHGGDHSYREMLRGLGKDLTRRVWYENPRAEDRPLQGNSPDSAYHFEGLMDLKQVEDLLPLGARAEDAMYFFCGPPGWMKSVAAQLTELGVDRDHTAFEFFGPAVPEVP